MPGNHEPGVPFVCVHDAGRSQVVAVQASDVVVTTGCGDACPSFPGTHHPDGELTDPAGQGLDTVREVRDEIRGRAVLPPLGTRLDARPEPRHPSRP